MQHIMELTGFFFLLLITRTESTPTRSLINNLKHQHLIISQNLEKIKISNTKFFTSFIFEFYKTGYQKVLDDLNRRVLNLQRSESIENTQEFREAQMLYDRSENFRRISRLEFVMQGLNEKFMELIDKIEKNFKDFKSNIPISPDDEHRLTSGFYWKFTAEIINLHEIFTEFASAEFEPPLVTAKDYTVFIQNEMITIIEGALKLINDIHFNFAEGKDNIAAKISSLRTNFERREHIIQLEATKLTNAVIRSLLDPLSHTMEDCSQISDSSMNCKVNANKICFKL